MRKSELRRLGLGKTVYIVEAFANEHTRESPGCEDIEPGTPMFLIQKANGHMIGFTATAEDAVGYAQAKDFEIVLRH